jgi:poly(A) polymerase
VKLPHATWQSGKDMEALLTALGGERDETRYVGGCVRDTLLGLPVSDVDLATRLRPQAVIERLNLAGIRSVPTGIAHGTVTAILKGRPIEITTLRRDVSTDGRRATVAFTDDWQEDAARRDFTINALSASPPDGTISDYFGGLADLEVGRLRFIGEPLQRIAEDHLRILRFFRFHARFGRGEPDAPAIEACAARANDLMALSRERIADELLKLLAVAEPLAAVALMVSLNILKPVLPEIDEAGVTRLERLLAREKQHGLPADPVRRLSALLPPTPTVAASVGARLRLSNKIIKRLVIAAEPADPGNERPGVLAYGIGLEGAVDRLLLRGEDASLGPALAALNGWTKPKLPVSGADLIAMGVEAGPAVSRLLQAVENEWASGGFEMDDETVQALARRHVERWLRSSQ